MSTLCTRMILTPLLYTHMITTIFWKKWLWKINAAYYYSLNLQNKVIIFTPSKINITHNNVDIIDDCFTMKQLKTNLKAVDTDEYKVVIVANLDVMIQNSFIKEEFGNILEMKDQLIKILLSLWSCGSEIFFTLNEKEFVAGNYDEKWNYQTSIMLFKPDVPNPLNNILEDYSDNCRRAEHTDKWTNIIMRPQRNSQTFSFSYKTNKIKPNEKMIDDTPQEDPNKTSHLNTQWDKEPKKEEPKSPEKTEDKSESTDDTKITWENEWLEIYKKKDNFFEQSGDAKWIFNKLMKKEMSIEEMKEKVSASKKLSQDKIDKALNFISDLEEYVN